MVALKNLCEGVDLPVTHDKIKSVADLLRQRLKDHQTVFDMERAPAIALLDMVQKLCKHKGAETGYNDRDGSWMSPCPTCGHSY